MATYLKDAELIARCEGTFASNEPIYRIYSKVADETFNVCARDKRVARITLCDYHIRILGYTDTHLADLVVMERADA